MSGDARLVRALVACYPAGWRQRYGDEYAQLLYDMRAHRRPELILNSLLGAARAYGGVIMTRRSPLTAAIWATALFTAAGIGFAKLAEDFSSQARGTHILFVVAAAVALVALAVAAAPSAVALARGRDAGAWIYVAVPVVSAAAWYGILRLALSLSYGHGVHTGATVTAFVIIVIAGLAVLGATAWAAIIVLGRVPGDQPARLRPLAAATVAAGMAVATIAALVWGLQLRSADPAVFNGDNGLLATPFVPSWIGVVVALAAAAVLAASSARSRPVPAR